MEYIAYIKADLSGYPGYEKLVFKQGDFTDRAFVVTLLKNGAPVKITGDITPRLQMRKPDGHQVLSDDNLEVLGDGTIKVTVTPQMSSAAGPGQIEIGLYRQNALLSTAVIDTLIYPSAMSMIKVASSNEYQTLIDALAQIAPAIDAEEKRKEAEAERIANEIVRQRQEIERERSTDAALEEVNFTVQDMINRRNNGEFNGPKGDTGPQGPQGIQGPKGDKGEDGTATITKLDPGVFGMSVKKGHLILTHNDTDPAPPLKVIDGRLKYLIGEESS